MGAITLSVSIDGLRTKATFTVAVMAAVVAGFAFIFLRRTLGPIASTAASVEEAVQRALHGDFKTHITQSTQDEIGQIAAGMNRLLIFLDDGLSRIGTNVARLTSRSTPAPDENQLDATIDMVERLTSAAHFKQAIEEDETTVEIYQRLLRTLEQEFAITEYSLYEVGATNTQMTPLFVDGAMNASCRWCDPQIVVRNQSCRARRTGHKVDGILNPGICYAFQPPPEVGARRHVCLPIIQSGAVGNVLQIIAAPETENAVAARIPYVTLYLQETAPVLEAKRLMDTLRESSLRDPMTGLNNRRFLEEYVDTLVAHAQRGKTHFAIMMLDLDYFKMVNDTHGHDAGDAVIKALAKVLRQSVRASDLVIRFGGEEFLIVLLDTPAEAADPVAEKIRAAVEQLEIKTSSIVLRKTISIGLAGFPTDSDTFWQTVKFADVALYQAKEGGRNRVVRFTAEMWNHDKAY